MAPVCSRTKCSICCFVSLFLLRFWDLFLHSAFLLSTQNRKKKKYLAFSAVSLEPMTIRYGYFFVFIHTHWKNSQSINPLLAEITWNGQFLVCHVFIFIFLISLFCLNHTDICFRYFEPSKHFTQKFVEFTLDFLSNTTFNLFHYSLSKRIERQFLTLWMRTQNCVCCFKILILMCNICGRIELHPKNWIQS